MRSLLFLIAMNFFAYQRSQWQPLLPHASSLAATDGRSRCWRQPGCFNEKVEELTLYTIQQDHEIESLKKEMAELRQLITSKSEKNNSQL